MVEDTPDDLIFDLHNAAVWGGHPLGYSILGTRETVSGVSVRDLATLHRRAYRPPLVVVAAAGNVDHDNLIEILGRTGWTGREAGIGPPPAAGQPGRHAPTRQHVNREGSQTHIVLGSPTIGHEDPRRHALVLLGVLLGGGMSSRLFQRVREELGLAYSVYTFQTFYANCGVHGVYVGTSPGSAGAALAAIEKELATVVSKGLPVEELAQGKGQLKGQITLSLESPTARMYRAAAVELYGEPYRSLDEMLSLIDKIRDKTVRELAAEFFAPQRQTVLSLGPGKGDAAKPKPRSARSKRSTRPRRRG